MSPRPKGRIATSALKGRIVAAAWDQIAQEGAPALSLRAIARALNISAPSIYNYFPDRDALVTALIVEAFTSFGDDQEKSLVEISPENHFARLRALGLAYREWAVSYPERYLLIFGTPIAGYSAPIEITMPAAARSLSILTGELASTDKDERLNKDFIQPIPQKVKEMLQAWQVDREPDVSIEVLFMALTIWARVHGLVSLEVGNQLPPYITDAGEIYSRELEIIISQSIRQENHYV